MASSYRQENQRLKGRIKQQEDLVPKLEAAVKDLEAKLHNTGMLWKYQKALKKFEHVPDFCLFSGLILLSQFYFYFFYDCPVMSSIHACLQYLRRSTDLQSGKPQKAFTIALLKICEQMNQNNNSIW